MSRVLLLALAATLAGCSGVSRVCDDVSGRCLVTWRDAGSQSAVTAAQVVESTGQPAGAPAVSVLAGWLSQVNPLASVSSAPANAATTSATAVKTLEK